MKFMKFSVQSLFRRVVDLLSAALAGGLILAVLGQLIRPNFQTAGLLFNLPMPVTFACLAQVLLTVALLVDPRPRPQPLRVAIYAVLLAFIAMAAWDTARYFALWSSRTIEPRRLLPLSFYEVVLLSLRLATAYASRRRRTVTPAIDPGRPRDARLRPIALAVAALIGAFCLPLAEQFFFGSTEYRHNGDVAMVLGAGIHPDGTPSDALSDRVNTAIALYKDGRVPMLLMTGGLDRDSGGSEPQVMKRLAVEAGVPADAIILDEAGNNTQASVRNTVALMRAAGSRDCLVVSHDYHLPRIKRMLDREQPGVRSYTVPSREARPLLKGPFYRLREVIAWHYYLLAPASRSAGATGE